ncbi:MAG: type II toxin-antitoxin system VapC family toxin [Verrucomicrobiota bacterium]
MSGILLDTNILIDYLRDHSQAVKYLEASSELMSISALTVAELHAGARNDTEKQKLREFTTAFEVIPADAAICEIGGDFRTTYALSHGIDLIDGLIAATSVVCDVPLVTLNKKHFPMLGNVIVPYRRRS